MGTNKSNWCGGDGGAGKQVVYQQRKDGWALNIPFTGQINLGRVALIVLLGLLSLELLRLLELLLLVKVLLLGREVVARRFFLNTKLDLFSSLDTGVRESGGDSSIFPFDA